MKDLQEIDKRLLEVQKRWMSAAPKDKMGYVPEINKLLDKRLEIKTKRTGE